MQRIPDSELLINDHGAIYHLNLRPEELAPLIILVGDPDRVPVISHYFDRIETKRQNRAFITHTGWVHHRRVSVVSTGIGPGNIDIVLNELDALVNIDLGSRTIKKDLTKLDIIRIGTCGSLQPDIATDSIVASTHGLGIDNLLHFYRHIQTEEDNHLLHSFVTQTQLNHQFCPPYITGASSSLLKSFAAPFTRGITVTCPGFYGPQGRSLRLGLSHPDLIDRLTQFRFGPHRIANFEMETAAIYGLSKLLGHRCISLSAVVANRVTKDFSLSAHAAVESLIQQVVQIIYSLV